MRTILFTRERFIYLINDTLGSVGIELSFPPLGGNSTVIQAGKCTPHPEIIAAWSPSGSSFTVGVAGLGPCTPPVYFYAANCSDLNEAQVEFLVQQLSQYPGTQVMIQPSQLDPSLLCGQANPVGIVNTPNRFPDIQK